MIVPGPVGAEPNKGKECTIEELEQKRMTKLRRMNGKDNRVNSVLPTICLLIND